MVRTGVSRVLVTEDRLARAGGREVVVAPGLEKVCVLLGWSPSG